MFRRIKYKIQRFLARFKRNKSENTAFIYEKE